MRENPSIFNADEKGKGNFIFRFLELIRLSNFFRVIIHVNKFLALMSHRQSIAHWDFLRRPFFS